MSSKDIFATLYRAAPGVEYDFSRLPAGHPDAKHKPVIYPLLALRQIGKTPAQLYQRYNKIQETALMLKDEPDMKEEERGKTLLQLNKWAALITQNAHQAKKCENNLASLGWVYDEKTQKLKALKTCGNAPKQWLNELICDWYEYLAPDHQRTTGDQTKNPIELRLLIQEKLARWFDYSEIPVKDGGQIQKAIYNYQAQTGRIL